MPRNIYYTEHDRWLTVRVYCVAVTVDVAADSDWQRGRKKRRVPLRHDDVTSER